MTYQDCAEKNWYNYLQANDILVLRPFNFIFKKLHSFTQIFSWVTVCAHLSLKGAFKPEAIIPFPLVTKGPLERGPSGG